MRRLLVPALPLVLIAGGSCAVRPLPGGYHMPSRGEIEAQVAAAQAASEAQREHAEGHVRMQERRSTDGVQVVFQTGHSGGITHLAMSPDGRYVASVGDNVVKLWDVASHKELRSFEGRLGGEAVGFSVDSRRLIIGDLGAARTGFAEAKIYDVTSGREIARMNLVSADGRIGVSRLLERIDQTQLAVTDFATGDSFPVKADAPLALSDNGATLVTRSVTLRGGALGFLSPKLRQELVVWDLVTRQELARLSADELASPLLSADGRFLFLEGPEGAIDAYDVRGKGKRTVVAATPGRKRVQAGSWVTSLVVSPDGRWLARWNPDGSRDLYDLQSGAKLLTFAAASAGPQFEASPGAYADRAFFSDDGKLFAAYGPQTGGGRVWEIPSGKPVTQLQISALAISRDGRTAVIGRQGSGAPVLRDLATDKESSLGVGVDPIWDVAITGDGSFAASTSLGGPVRVWDLATGQLARSFACPGGAPAGEVSASAREPLLAFSCLDRSAWLWNVATEPSPQLLAPPNPVAGAGFTPLRFSADGRLLAIGAANSVVLWDVAAGQEMRELVLPLASVPQQIANPAANFDIDPEMLKSMSPAQRKMLEQAREGARVFAADRTLQAQIGQVAQQVIALAIQPDGRLLAIGSGFELALWDLQTGQRVRVLSGQDWPSPEPTGEVQGDGQAPFVPLTGGHNLAFSSDGRILYAGGRRWDVASGQRLPEPPAPVDPGNPFASSERPSRMEGPVSAAVAASPQGLVGASGVGQVVRLFDLASGRELGDLVGHTNSINALAFSRDGSLLASGGADGALRLWRLPDRQELVALYALGATDSVAVTPDQYYRASKSRLAGISFRVRDQMYPFEQFDLRFNRPDIILERLGRAPAAEVRTYRTAYARRLKKMGFSESMLNGDFHLPEIAIVSDAPPVSTDASSVSLRVRSSDDKYLLDRINAFVNDVPVFGTAGIALPDRQSHADERELQVPLVPGLNKIQISVLNQQGVESLRQTVYTTSIANPGAGDVYVVAIGVSEYQNPRYNLRYAAKDAADLMNAYHALTERTGAHGQVHLLDLTNQKATRTGIRQARGWLKQAHVNDLAVIFAAGHGMTDDRQDYYFGTYDIDPAQPQINGLPYEEFEELLDGIPPLRKMLLIDTCFSGEIDKDEPAVLAEVDTGGAGSVKMRVFKTKRAATPADAQQGAGTPAPLASDVLHFQELFADLRRGTGAVVISSASGNEYALEGEQWRNGVFTYALLSGLKQGKADANEDGVVTVGELQAYVIDAVRWLTLGGQNPTVRRENLDYDFVVY